MPYKALCAIGHYEIGADHRTSLRKGILPTVCRSGIGDECSQFGVVFLAWGGFDTGDYVNAPGVEGGDGFGYVFWGQAAGDDKFVRFRVLEEGLGSEGPVEGLAGATYGCSCARVDQNCVKVGVAKACLRG